MKLEDPKAAKEHVERLATGVSVDPGTDEAAVCLSVLSFNRHVSDFDYTIAGTAT